MSARHFCVLAISLLVLPMGAQAADPPRVVAHRGLLQHAPENTLANFRACLELRLGFEFDVQRTKDGQLVCIHDTDVERTTDGVGRVAEMTLAQIQALDAGSWFDARFAGEKAPTVEEVLELISEHGRSQPVLIAVDLKAEEVELDVVRLAQKHKVLGHLLFIGRTITESAVRRAIREESAEAHLAAVANRPEEFQVAVADADADWVYVRYIPSSNEVAVAREAGKRVFIAGISVSGNVPAQWRQATHAGVDGILTDYPLELQAMLRRAVRAK